jgi:hypothetical protein
LKRRYAGRHKENKAMTVKFQSQATGDLVMIQKHAHAVLKLIGKSEDGPGILETGDMPAALNVLKGLPHDPERPKKPERQAQADTEEDSDFHEMREPDFIDEAISLRKRAWPLVTMIERAMHEGKPIVWNVTI